MWKLIKNTWRSLAKNKIAMISLVFLIFLATFLFCGVGSAISAIKSEYHSIITQGKLHDITINEQYDQGKVSYSSANIASTQVTIDGQSIDTWLPIKQYELSDGSNSIFYREYQLQIDLSQTSGLFLEFYNNHIDNNQYDYILKPIIKVAASVEGNNGLWPYYEYTNTNDQIIPASKEPSTIADSADLAQTIDQKAIDEAISSLKNQFSSLTLSTDTPMVSYINQNYQNELSYRSFESIDVNNTSSVNNFYKVINQEPSKTNNIDNLYSLSNNDHLNLFVEKDGYHLNAINNFIVNNKILLSGQMVSDDSSDNELLSYTMTNSDLQSNQLSYQAFYKLYLLSQLGNFGSDTLVQEFFNGFFEDAINNSISLNTKLDTYIKRYQNNEVINLSGAETKVVWQGTIPRVCTITNWTSKFAVVNPQFVEANEKTNITWKDVFATSSDYIKYCNDHQIKYNTNAALVEWINQLSWSEFNNWFNSIYNESYGLKIDAIDFIIIDQAITPDYIYPIVSFNNIVPNYQNEAIVYVNQSGFNRVNEAFVGNPHENYLVARFNDSLSQEQKKAILDDINQYAATCMTYGSIKAAYWNNDVKNILNTSAYRVVYIPKLIDKINTLSMIIIITILVLTIFVCAIIIFKYVNNQRSTIGVIFANGFNKKQIIASLFPFALLPSFIGGIAGYLTGVFTQSVIMKIFKNYWNIPTSFADFSIIGLGVSLLLIFVILMLITTISSLIVLREKPTVLMKEGSENKANILSRMAKISFSKFSIITRFRVALAFNGFWRLVLLTLLSTITMTTINFSFAVVGKYTEAKNITFANQKYSYAVDLVTPTEQGGQYYAIPYNQVAIANPSIGKYSLYWNDTTDSENFAKDYYHINTNTLNALKDHNDSNNNIGNLWVPFAEDAFGKDNDLFYTKNKASSKLTLNYTLGVGSASVNVWDSCLSLMPENTRKISETKYQNLINALAETFAQDVNYQNFFIKKGNDWSISNNAVASLTGLKPEFIQFLRLIYADNQYQDFVNQDYGLLYNMIPLGYNVDINSWDQTYTYIESNMIGKSTIGGFDSNKTIKIMGINANSEDYISIINNDGKNIYDLIGSNSISSNNIPLIANQYAKLNYNLSVGSEITFKINNAANRYTKLINQDDTNQEVTFKIVGFSNGCNQDEFYTSQNIANYILGLTCSSDFLIDGVNPTPMTHYEYDYNNNTLVNVNESLVTRENVQVGFNGIFTNNKDGSNILSHSISFYSKSGLYPSVGIITTDNANDPMIAILSQGNNLEIAKTITGINAATAQEFVNQLVSIYGSTSVVSTITNAVDKYGIELVFDNLATTSDYLCIIILSFVLAITVLIIILISNLIISDSKKLAAILNALGFRNHQNANSFLSVYIPIVFIGIILSIPLTLALSSIYQLVAFQSAGILLSTSVKWFYFLGGISIFVLVLLVSWLAGWITLRKDRLIDRIRS